ncbi:TVP38/TMEM64 family protein [Corynebacterium sp. zg254]|uniref:TVP38/TMEM64 family membrane protein n=1 Tax=Corynebacterium zhongnanshanii TaxID=2768834 RepID=A0ABQ6VGG7_9CORY|nr:MULTISPECIES: TVP38/TMEM64 family protein [Corynebacterium]KAB3523500.1 TVP38/TMEM64 family protein [Corynebacterium zhongnanshanii]MCR5913352.1 TVP38/TMEM64 family protein [Corynebacterium sp. zg254]
MDQQRENHTQDTGRPHFFRKYRKIFLAIVLLLALLAVMRFAPLPDPEDIRNRVQAAGTWAPVVFIVLMVFFTQFPLPRTVWTIAAGLLFGAVLGSVVALIGLSLSAMISLTLVRRLGRRWVEKKTQGDNRLHLLQGIVAERGWIAVLGMRMVPAIPFSILNYSCGLAMMPMAGFLFSTVVGSAPNTIATVMAADALASGSSPWILALSFVVVVSGFALSARELLNWRAQLKQHDTSV